MCAGDAFASPPSTVTVSAMIAMTALVAGLCVFCAIICAALQRHSALIWMGIALAIGVLESLALKDGDITRVDLWLMAATVPLSYLCVGESVRAAFGLAPSGLRFFTVCGAMVLLTLVLLQSPLPAVLQFLPSQLAGAAAMARTVVVVQKARRRGDLIDLGLLVTLGLVTTIYLARIPFFPVLVGMEPAFGSISRQNLQDILIVTFAVLVPAVVFLTVARAVANSLQLYRMKAEHDFLTNLPNRRAFEALANCETRGSGTLVVCDIDRFKRINDRFGHAAGDAVIQAVASLLDGEGFAARIGGEEFAIWLPRSNVEETRRHAERLRRELTTLRLVELADDYAITASFGIVACPSDMALAKALRAADDALYLAKNSGRNCVCIYGECAPQQARQSRRQRAAA